MACAGPIVITLIEVSREGNVPAWWPMSGLDLIPDAETALKIGRVILERYYGDSLVRRYEPYHASPNASMLKSGWSSEVARTNLSQDVAVDYVAVDSQSFRLRDRKSVV